MSWMIKYFFNVGACQGALLFIQQLILYTNITLILNALLMMNPLEICFILWSSHSYGFGLSYHDGMCITQIFEPKQTRYFLFPSLWSNHFQIERRKERKKNQLPLNPWTPKQQAVMKTARPCQSFATDSEQQK